jgi:hypothetical protein
MVNIFGSASYSLSVLTIQWCHFCMKAVIDNM